jgi:hypothetical protein
MFCLHLALSYDDTNLSKIFILDGFKGITLHIYPQPLTYESGYLNFSTLWKMYYLDQKRERERQRAKIMKQMAFYVK